MEAYSNLVVLFVAMATWCSMSSSDDIRLPVPCTDLVPLDLLKEAVPTLDHIPPGVSVVYVASSHTHAFQFTTEANRLEFKANKIFKRCEYFPEEFSIFIVLKHTQRRKRQECLFSLVDDRTNKIIISVKLTKVAIVFQYDDKTFRFKTNIFSGDKWHTLGFSMAGDTVVMTTDCRNRRQRQVRRAFPEFLPMTNTSFIIGGCKRKRTLFQGYLKDLILVPGADAVAKVCPPKRHRRMDNTVTTFPHAYEQSPFWPQRVQCSWSDVGNLAFDVYSDKVKVCVNGIWKEVNIQTGKKKLDYFEAYHDVQTPAASIDVEVFTLLGEGLFAVFAGQAGEGDSALFKWVENQFTFYQKLETEAAQSWCHFTIKNQFFLAVANYGSSPDQASNSTVYRWHKKRKKFKPYQTFVTWTARDFEYFKIDGQHYLAVANHAQGDNTMVDSVIYKWDFSQRNFTEFQSIMTVGAYDWTHFVVNDFHFIAIANAFNGLTTLIDSVIYFWQNDRFVQFQTMETNGATDWEFFSIDGDHFLAVANAYNYGPQNYKDVDTFYTNSTIYKLNRQKRVFEKFQIVPTYSAIDWEYVRVGGDHFLVVSNAQNGGEGEELASVVYRWQGLDRFVPVHRLKTLPSADWETFTQGEDIYLIYANAKESTSQIIKAKFT
ncbi:thrombospondin-type laminin G domain and EAR repeat-containing protein-like [Haliotis rufescens]|uniref:thrombospondin-type laminin G domain and EAR repeat-containing protein-like n=1 Tax=Haliotis rufescens TaxID=6454 RepID=UPI00201F5357|nr:thrombospondin-type laminin G domain and EAR repeat-containing protein-like [Haliotis rufescens]XP_046377704.2 thrombospondin-type laminin G domain and EAR repeat-containing protein-like [Haliotis rufescens]